VSSWLILIHSCRWRAIYGESWIGLRGRLTAAGAAVARSSALLPDLAEAARLHTRMVRNAVNFGRPRLIISERCRRRVAALSLDDDSLKAWADTRARS